MEDKMEKITLQIEKDSDGCFNVTSPSFNFHSVFGIDDNLETALIKFALDLKSYWNEIKDDDPASLGATILAEQSFLRDLFEMGNA